MRHLWNLILIASVALSSHWLTLQQHKAEIKENEGEGRVTGIGGVFFKAEDPAALRKWYEENLNFKTNGYGTVFRFGNQQEPEGTGYLQWSPFIASSDYFDKEYMINYRVEHIEDLVETMRNNGVIIVDDIATYNYGKFVHIKDLEGTKIQLWEPVDSEFEKYLDDAVMGY